MRKENLNICAWQEITQPKAIGNVKNWICFGKVLGRPDRLKVKFVNVY